MKRIILLFCAIVFALSTYSQSTYTDRLRKNEAGKGTVVIRQSDEIERIVNGKQKPQSSAKTSTTNKSNTPSGNGSTNHSPQTSNTPSHNNPPSTNSGEKKESPKTPSEHKSRPTQKANTTNRTPNHSYVTRARHKARGFRICIFTGGNSRADKTKAIQMGNKCRAKFRELAVYPSFEAPRWVTHVGDFKTRQEAQKYVKLIRRARISYEVRIVASEVNIPY